MKLFRYLILGFSTLACTISFANDPEDRQMEAIQKFINEKQKINLRKKSVDLTIGGDIRLDWEHLTETIDGVDQRKTQADSDLPLGKNEYDATFNFLVDYKNDKAWATTWLQFNNLLGSKVKDIGGTYNKISLRRAMVGYRLVDEGDLTFNIRAGRTRGYNLFDSKVMYGSNYDGVFFEVGYSQPEWFDFNVMGGPFIVSQQDSHYGNRVSIVGWMSMHYGLNQSLAVKTPEEFGRLTRSVAGEFEGDGGDAESDSGVRAQ